MYDQKPDLNKPTPIELAARLVRGTPTYSDCAWAAAMLRDFSDELTALRTELAEAKHTIARVSFYAGQSTGEIRMLKQRVAELEAERQLMLAETIARASRLSDFLQEMGAILNSSPAPGSDAAASSTAPPPER